MTSHLEIRPTVGDIDLDHVRRWLDARPDAFEDPHGSGAYLLCGAPTEADLAYRLRLADGSRFPIAVIVTLAPDRIHIDHEKVGAAALESSRALVHWLTDTFGVELFIDGSTTPWAGDDLADLYPAGVSGTTPDGGALVGVGFFRDLTDGHDTTVALEHARRDRAEADEDLLVQYLESGRLHRTTDTEPYDPLDESDDDPEIPAPHIYTDGVYEWRGDLAYFVRTYHVRLPRHFLLHARANGWRVDDTLDRDTAASAVGDRRSLRIERAGVVLGRSLRSGAGNQVREGYLASDPATRVLVTMTLAHEAPLDPRREEVALDVPGIAALRWLGRMPDDSIGFEDVLVEDLPDGRPAAELAPMREIDVIDLGADAARVLAAAHQRDLVVRGVLPELIYVDRRARFAALVPRGPAFVNAAPATASGLSCYPVPYLAPELLGGNEPGAASDVFALCATLQHLATGEHPFGSADSIMALLNRVLHDDRIPYRGSDRLAALLARGMARDPAARPTAAELADALAALRVAS